MHRDECSRRLPRARETARQRKAETGLTNLTYIFVGPDSLGAAGAQCARESAGGTRRRCGRRATSGAGSADIATPSRPGAESDVALQLP